jgi:hypothetical protein
MGEPTKKQLQQLHKDITSGLVMTVETKHYKELEAEVARLKENHLAIYIVAINKHTGETKVTEFPKKGD